jgi:hypothetical protein
VYFNFSCFSYFLLCWCWLFQIKLWGLFSWLRHFFFGWLLDIKCLMATFLLRTYSGLNCFPDSLICIIYYVTQQNTSVIVWSSASLTIFHRVGTVEQGNSGHLECLFLNHISTRLALALVKLNIIFKMKKDVWKIPIFTSLYNKTCKFKVTFSFFKTLYNIQNKLGNLNPRKLVIIVANLCMRQRNCPAPELLWKCKKKMWVFSKIVFILNKTNDSRCKFWKFTEILINWTLVKPKKISF